MSPRVREDSVHPRLQSGAYARPLNFTVRRQVTQRYLLGHSAVIVGFIIAIIMCALFQVGSATRLRGALFGFLGSAALILFFGVNSGHWDSRWTSYAAVLFCALVASLLVWFVAYRSSKLIRER